MKVVVYAVDVQPEQVLRLRLVNEMGVVSIHAVTLEGNREQCVLSFMADGAIRRHSLSPSFVQRIGLAVDDEHRIEVRK
jgi:hypothetical protein